MVTDGLAAKGRRRRKRNVTQQLPSGGAHIFFVFYFFALTELLFRVTRRDQMCCIHLTRQNRHVHTRPLYNIIRIYIPTYLRRVYTHICLREILRERRERRRKGCGHTKGICEGRDALFMRRIWPLNFFSQRRRRRSENKYILSVKKFVQVPRPRPVTAGCCCCQCLDSRSFLLFMSPEPPSRRNRFVLPRSPRDLSPLIDFFFLSFFTYFFFFHSSRISETGRDDQRFVHAKSLPDGSRKVQCKNFGSPCTLSTDSAFDSVDRVGTSSPYLNFKVDTAYQMTYVFTKICPNDARADDS